MPAGDWPPPGWVYNDAFGWLPPDMPISDEAKAIGDRVRTNVLEQLLKDQAATIARLQARIEELEVEIEMMKNGIA